MCTLEHTSCTQQDRFSEAPTARPMGFVVDVGGPGLLRAQGGWAMLGKTISEDQGLLGELKGLWQTKGCSRSVGLQQGESDSECLFAGLSVGSAPVADLGRGGHG